MHELLLRSVKPIPNTDSIGQAADLVVETLVEANSLQNSRSFRARMPRNLPHEHDADDNHEPTSIHRNSSRKMRPEFASPPPTSPMLFAWRGAGDVCDCKSLAIVFM